MSRLRRGYRIPQSAPGNLVVLIVELGAIFKPGARWGTAFCDCTLVGAGASGTRKAGGGGTSALISGSTATNATAIMTMIKAATMGQRLVRTSGSRRVLSSMALSFSIQTPEERKECRILAEKIGLRAYGCVGWFTL
jgi:hypothetical protein